MISIWILKIHTRRSWLTVRFETFTYIFLEIQSHSHLMILFIIKAGYIFWNKLFFLTKEGKRNDCLFLLISPCCLCGYFIWYANKPWDLLKCSTQPWTVLQPTETILKLSAILREHATPVQAALMWVNCHSWSLTHQMGSGLLWTMLMVT